jgi:soluble lytic murein transglycosylase
MAPSARVALFALMLAACHRGASDSRPQEPPGPALDGGLRADGAALPIDPAALDVVLADPRLAAAAARAEEGDHAAAAKALSDALRTAPPDFARACAWRYLEGRMSALAGDDMAAAAAFDRAGGADDQSACPLAEYARYRAAQAYLRRGRGDLALARAKAVKDAAVADEATLTQADALAMAGDRAGAVPLWRAYLAAHPKSARWAEVSGKLAKALLDGTDAAPPSHAREAHDLATRIAIEAPAADSAIGAMGLRSRAAALDATLPRGLTPDQQQRRAQGWLDGGRGDKAFSEATALAKQLTRPEDHELGCRVATTRAQASARTKASTKDAWQNAVAACDGSGDALAVALYNAGKSASSKSPGEAVAYFARLEQAQPAHKLADDARLKGALLTRDLGDAARAAEMLDKLADDYPAGDMRSEALFRAALARMGRGEWSLAMPWLDRAAAVDAGDRHWSTSGRAAYFRARASAMTGDAVAAKAGYAAIVRERPLAFYMLLAFARLSELDGPLARQTLSDAEGREAEGNVLTRERAEVGASGFSRALRLLEVGEFDAAKRELVACGVLSDSADAELVWVAARLFDRAGAPEIGSAWSRGRVQDHLGHYPRGRWRAMWEAAYPRAFEPLVTARAEAQRAPRPLVWGIMREESAFYPEATSPSPAFGLMQLIASTAKLTAQGTGLAFDEASLKRPQVSITLGAKLLSSLRSSYPGNPALAIPAYNAGSGAVGRWLAQRGAEDFDLWVEEIPFEETRGYTKRVLSSVAAYAYLYDAPLFDEVLHLPKIADGRAAQ